VQAAVGRRWCVCMFGGWRRFRVNGRRKLREEGLFPKFVARQARSKSHRAVHRRCSAVHDTMTGDDDSDACLMKEHMHGTCSPPPLRTTAGTSARAAARPLSLLRQHRTWQCTPPPAPFEQDCEEVVIEQWRHSAGRGCRPDAHVRLQCDGRGCAAGKSPYVSHTSSATRSLAAAIATYITWRVDP
jgi:hypothetical protein